MKNILEPDSSTIEGSGQGALTRENMRPAIHFVITATAGAVALGSTATPAAAANVAFGPENPFYAPSTLPFQAPPFDRIQDSDYQPAIEAGMAQQLAEIRAIARSGDVGI